MTSQLVEPIPAPPVRDSLEGARVRPWLAALGAVVLLVAGATFAMSTGVYKVSVGDVLAVVAHRGLHLPVEEPANPTIWSVVWQLRFPRVALAALTGAGLALAGVASQALVRNALADPFVLGVSSGATLAYVAAAAWGIGATGILGQSATAFVGAFFALLLVVSFAARSTRASPLRLILAGIALAHLFASLTTYLVIRRLNGGSGRVQALLSGNLQDARLDRMWLPLGVILLALLALACDADKLNALIVGDETATSLGVNVLRLRLRLCLITAALVGVTVVQTGIIGFVGLVVPHMARWVVGTDHRRVVPVAALGGAVFMVWCDYAANRIALPHSLPIGFVAGAVGGPMFLLMIRRGLVGRRG